MSRSEEKKENSIETLPKANLDSPSRLKQQEERQSIEDIVVVVIMHVTLTFPVYTLKRVMIE